MNPNLRNLFMKPLTRDLVVPIISASVSWLIFATGSGFNDKASYPCAHCRWVFYSGLTVGKTRKCLS